jgi:hypothetical protein
MKALKPFLIVLALLCVVAAFAIAGGTSRVVSVRSAVATYRAEVVPCPMGRIPVVENVLYKPGHANDTFAVFTPSGLGRTTISASALYSVTAINLVGDAGVKNTLNGHAVTAAALDTLTGDWLMYKTAVTGWHLAKIAAVNASGADGVITITTLSFTKSVATAGDASGDGLTAGDTAYVVDENDVHMLRTGATTFTEFTGKVAIGNPECPIGVLHGGGDTAVKYTIAPVAFYSIGD